MDWQVAKPWSVVAKRRVANAGGAQSGDFPGYGASQKPPYGPLDCPTTYKFPADKGPLQLVPERRAAEQNFWAAACGELQATAKPRTVRRPGQQRPIRPLAASLASSCPNIEPVARGNRWWQRAYEPTLWQATVVVRPVLRTSILTGIIPGF